MTRSHPKRRANAAWSATSSRWERTIVRTPPSPSIRSSSGREARGESTSTFPAGRTIRYEDAPYDASECHPQEKTSSSRSSGKALSAAPSGRFGEVPMLAVGQATRAISARSSRSPASG